MQVTSARLHREILLRPDPKDNRRTFQRGADIEAPQLLQLFVIIGDHPAILQRREKQASRSDGCAGTDFDIRHRLRQYLAGDGVIRGDRTVVEVAGVAALLEFGPVEPTVGPLERSSGTVAGKAAFG